MIRGGYEIAAEVEFLTQRNIDRYIIRDLNANSAIASPDHDEILDTAKFEPNATYKLKGYAYAGGGRRVTRVEISSDDGNSWRLANIDYPEDLFRKVVHFDPIYGDLDMTDSDTCFCWCFWSFDIEISALKASRAIMVRCMDESLALQPRDMYWNATGMMNNWCVTYLYFRRGTGRSAESSRSGGSACAYTNWTMESFASSIPLASFLIHSLTPRPKLTINAVAGTQPGGWMQRLKDEGLDPAKPNFSTDPATPSTSKVEISKPAETVMTKQGVDRKITVAELESSEAKEQAWFVVRGEVRYRMIIPCHHSSPSPP
jgi:nitrate reductase (NAD(P)H)